jgi:hypothetical protein
VVLIEVEWIDPSLGIVRIMLPQRKRCVSVYSIKVLGDVLVCFATRKILAPEFSEGYHGSLSVQSRFEAADELLYASCLGGIGGR